MPVCGRRISPLFLSAFAVVAAGLAQTARAHPPAPFIQGIDPLEAGLIGTAPSAEAAQFGALRDQSEAVTDAIFDRIRDLSRALALGLPRSASAPDSSRLAAAADPSDPGAWIDASGSYLADTAAVGYHGSNVIALTGLDTVIDKRWVAGFSAGYTHDDLIFKSVASERTANGAVFGPYAAYIIAPHLSLNGLFNYTRLSNSILSVFPGPNGSFGSNRLIGAGELDFYADKGPFKLTGFGGYSYSWEGADNNLLSATPPFSNTLRYGVLKLGGEAGYQTGATELYLPLKFEYETTSPRDGTGRAALVVGAGVRYRWSAALKLGLVATTTQLKSHYEDVLIAGNLRVSF